MGRNTLSQYPDKRAIAEWKCEILMFSHPETLCSNQDEVIFFESQQSTMPSFIELLPQDVDRYKALKNGQKELTAALKLSKKRGSASGGDE
jgi:hypothetical protein